MASVHAKTRPTAGWNRGGPTRPGRLAPHRTARSYLDWAESDAFRPGLLRARAYGATGATLLGVRQDRAIPDPATPDVTLQLCTRGELELASDVGGVRFSGRMRKGHFGVMPADTPIDLSGEGRFEFDVLVLNGGRVREILEADRADGVAAFARLYGRILADARVTALVRARWDDVASGRVDGRVYADTALAHVVHHLAGLGQAAPDRAVGGLAPWQVRRATEALADADGRTLSLDELAALVGLSPFHFCRAFKQSVGVPPHRHQIAMRVERARRLLEGTEVSVTEIAQRVGYDSSQALARAFRREVGVSPTAYRRHARG